MSPLRQPLTMVQLAQQQMVDMVVQASEGLISTPGDPTHVATIGQLHLAVRSLPPAAATKLSLAALAAVDRNLVVDYAERITSETMSALGLESLSSRAGDLLADVAGIVALSVPVDKEVARSLLFVAIACLPPSTTTLDATGLSIATVSAMVSQLHQMQLDTLRLTTVMGPSLTKGMVYPLARALHSMQKLTVVTLPQSASDNVLRVLAQACPNTLEELDVSYSRNVTDKGVAALVSCTNVRVVKNAGRVPDLGRALEAVVRDAVSEVGREELPLRSFKSDRPPPLPLLAEHCPRLVAVTIVLAEAGDYYRVPSLAALGNSVAGLQRLTLTCEEPGSNDLVAELLDCPEVAEDLGSQATWEEVPANNSLTPPPSPEQLDLPAPLDALSVLKLRGTAFAAWDLWAIGSTCPHLQRLVLQALPPSSSCKRPHQLTTQRLPQGAFRRLRVFTAEDLLPDVELLVLSRGHALEEVSLGHYDAGVSRVSFGDDALLEVLRENPMEQLRLFSVDEAPFLGARSVRRLLECPQLTLIAHLDSWGQLPAEQLEELQVEADSRNLDVCLAGTVR